MIEANFESRTHKNAAIAGVYQYDTGQRLRMRGLPTPDELAEMDDFLAGDVVTVQAQYGYAGDSQTETRIASFDAETGCWMADIPDVYLKRSGAVKVFVYVSYGATADETRAKTCYEGSFTPISRPAPSTQVTPSQSNAWDALVTEINLTLSKMNTAISEANAAAEGAKTQAAEALRAMGLPAEAFAKRPEALSGGMRRRVALARMVCFGGDVWLMDEAFKGLDTDSKHQVMNELLRYAEGRLIVMVTHDEQDARYMDAHIIRLTGPPLTIQRA